MSIDSMGSQPRAQAQSELATEGHTKYDKYKEALMEQHFNCKLPPQFILHFLIHTY